MSTLLTINKIPHGKVKNAPDNEIVINQYEIWNRIVRTEAVKLPELINLRQANMSVSEGLLLKII